jgi:S-adenosylmethionine-diacylgycerolhomoserine-N-methlytransferase
MITQNSIELKKYYKLHSKIYDFTRSFFLFGRKKLINSIECPNSETIKILEVGCGTGKNIINLAQKIPKAQIKGIDISPEMLTIARRKTQNNKNISLVEQSFLLENKEQYDIVVFSYVLTMINPDWQLWIDSFVHKIKPNGAIYIVDFHNSRFPWFHNHMKNNHVIMNGQILEKLKNQFEVSYSISNSFLGIWTYFIAKVSLKK